MKSVGIKSQQAPARLWGCSSAPLSVGQPGWGTAPSPSPLLVGAGSVHPLGPSWPHSFAPSCCCLGAASPRHAAARGTGRGGSQPCPGRALPADRFLNPPPVRGGVLPALNTPCAILSRNGYRQGSGLNPKGQHRHGQQRCGTPGTGLGAASCASDGNFLRSSLHIFGSLLPLS